MRMIFVIFTVFILLVSNDAPAQEQERPVPPPREPQVPATDRIEREEPQRERLPEFELPEYIITGRAVFRLPYVQKPKFSEQNVYIAEVSETMTGVDRGIDTSPIDVPTKSFGEFTDIPSMQHGQVRIGFGLFNTPVFSGWTNLRTAAWDVSGRLSYMNTEGYEPFAKGYDVDGSFQFGYRIPQNAPAFFRGGRPYLAIGFEGFKYGLFTSMVADTSQPVNGFPMIPGGTDLRDRTFRSNLSEIGFQSGPDAPFDYDLSFAWRGSTIEDERGPVPQLNDDELQLRLSTLGYIGPVRFRSDINYIANNLDFEIDRSINDPRFFKGSVKALFPVLSNFLSIELGGSYYSFNDTHSDSETSVKPFVEMRVMPGRTLTLYGRFAPEIIHRSLYSLQTSHPYISWGDVVFTFPPVTHEFAIVPTDEKINVAAGTEYTPHRRLTVNAFAQYREIDAYPGFHLTDHYGTNPITYLGTSTLFSVNADIRYAISDRDIITTQTTLNYSKNDFFDKTVPYIAPVEIAAMYTRDFPFGLRATAGFEYLSARRASYLGSSPESHRTLVNLSLDLQYQFHNIMGMYIKLDNILDQSYERYYTYPARPFYIEGGIQISF